MVNYVFLTDSVQGTL